jgi:hypothetical protein
VPFLGDLGPAWCDHRDLHARHLRRGRDPTLHGDDRHVRDLAVPCRRTWRVPDRTRGPPSRRRVTDRRAPPTASPRPVVSAGGALAGRNASTASVAGESAPPDGLAARDSATVAAIAHPLPVLDRVRWDVLVDGFAAIPAEHPVAAAADPASRDCGHHEWKEVGAMVTVPLTGGRTTGRPDSGPRSARPLAAAARGIVR